MSNYLLSYFPETDLRYGHDGLAAVAKKAGKPVSKLKIGQFLLFVNRKQSAVKIITADNIMIHLKSKDNAPLNFRAINMLPKYFNGTRFNYAGALRESLEKALDEKYGRSRIAAKRLKVA